MNPRDLINKLEQEDAAGLETSDALSALYQTDEPAQITSITALDQGIMRAAQEQIKPTPWWLKVGGFATAATVLLAVVISLDVQQNSSTPATLAIERKRAFELEADANPLAASNHNQTELRRYKLLQDLRQDNDKLNPQTPAAVKKTEQEMPYAATAIAELDQALFIAPQEKTADFNEAADSSDFAAAPIRQRSQQAPPPTAAMLAKPGLESAPVRKAPLEEVVVTASKRVAPKPMALQPLALSDASQGRVTNTQKRQLAELKTLLDHYIQHKTYNEQPSDHLLDVLRVYQQRYGEAKLHADAPRLSLQKTLLLLLSKAQTSRLPALKTSED